METEDVTGFHNVGIVMTCIQKMQGLRRGIQLAVAVIQDFKAMIAEQVSQIQ